MDELLTTLLAKVGAPTLALMAFAVMWDRIADLRERVNDIDSRLYALNGNSNKDEEG